MRDELFSTLSWLTAAARDGSADPARLARAADRLFNAVQAVDQKKFDALERTTAIAHADALLRAEQNPNRRAILRARFGLSHSAISWHLRRNRDSPVFDIGGKPPI
jgi:hypothetical protein